MVSGRRLAALLVIGGGWLAWARLGAQQGLQPLGTVATRDARVTGGLEVRGDQARLLSNVGITAFDRTAPVVLARGGEVLVCATSEFHLLRSGASGALVFGLDRGAIELRSGSQVQDAVLTPDLKLVPVTPGAYDLRLRVTREGDTCIDNAGAHAPVLNASDPFSAASYRILPGQHLLFVKGDLHRVVDHERSPCGCPAAGQMIAGNGAAANHPFPEAESQGLAPPTAPPGNAAPAGTASSQVSTTLSYGEAPATAPGATTPTGGQPASTVAPEPAVEAEQARGGFFGAVGRFFHRIFHPGDPAK